ncbi:dihydrofolate reductase [Siminovitchia fordii]|uniref:dihydrofolate reductase n=1 Tax=Siminovitchia fordii TaxID=254759 RepID=A0ABQ4KA66_9BACI|nr:dihydrofolate reductase [Siminovitchia fordii]GIN22496.1 dihydrofolate reductase [Siminovitchia fordii]
MSINLIACCDLNRAIGYQGKLLTRLPKDLKRFKELTTNNFIVMGRRTYQEIGEPLPNRTNLILSKSGDFDFHQDLYVYNSAESILQEYYDHADEDAQLYVCGGEQVYNCFMPHADKIYLTIVSHKFENADTYFSTDSLDDFKITSYVKHKADNNHPYDYAFVEYTRGKRGE